MSTYGRLTGLLVLSLLIVLGCDGTDPPADLGRADRSAGPTARPTRPQTDDVTAAGTVNCPPATITVRDAGSLAEALARARPGHSIRMANGTYAGRFIAGVSGTGDRPIFLCGGSRAVLDGGGIKGGYALHLDGASYFRLVGFTVRNGQKAVVTDRVRHTVIQGLTVEHIGDEAIHLRNFSSDNIVQGNTVRETGLRKPNYGEGVYIGTAKSNWCTITDCRPDLSDRNIVRGNHISATTAESVDIKEGTTGGAVIGNTFDGSQFSGSFADSWVDVKGNDWLIQANTGHYSPADGFQTHEVVPGWGTRNTFKANKAYVNGPGWGFHLAPVNRNTVSCDNTVIGGASGFANVDCG